MLHGVITTTSPPMFKSSSIFALALGLGALAPAALVAAPHGTAIALQKAEAPVTGTVTVGHEGNHRLPIERKAEA